MNQNNEPTGLNAFEGLFTLPPRPPPPPPPVPPKGGNVTTEEAIELDTAGKFFDSDRDNYPLYNAPRDFYQWKARQKISNAVSPGGLASGVGNVFDHLEAFSEVLSPVTKPLIDQYLDPFQLPFNIMPGSAPAFNPLTGKTKSQNIEKYKWSENTTDAITNLFKGDIYWNDAVEQISNEFQERPLTDQLLLSIADPTQIGKAKAALVGGNTLLAGLPFAVGRTSSKLKNLAKDPKLNLRLNHWDSVMDNVPKPSPKEFFKKMRLGFEEQTTDKFAYANKVTNRLQNEWREMFGDIKMPEEMNIEMQLSLFNGLGSSVSVKITDVLNQIRKLAIDNDINSAHISEFLSIKHLEAVHDAHPNRALPAGFKSKEDFGNHLNTMADELTGPRMAAVIESARLIRNEYKRILEEFINDGMVDRELGETLMNMYPWYNPIAYSDDAAIVLSGNKSEGTKVLKYLSDKGNVENLDVLPPLEIFPQMISRLEFMLARNKVNRNFVHALEMMGEPVTEIKGKNVPVAVQKVFDDVESAWKDEKIFRHQQLDVSKINKPVIHYLGDGGKLKVFEVSPEAFRSLNMMNSLNAIDNRLFRTVSRIQGAFKTAYTSGSVSFVTRQLINDMITVAMLEKALPHRAGAAMLRVVKDMFKENPMLRDLRLAGGDVTGYHGRDWEIVLEDMMKVKEGNQSVLSIDGNNWSRLFNPINWVNNLKRIAHNLEMAPRLAVFDTNLNAGETREYAAWRARNATVDFQRSGLLLRILNGFYAFANVATQGSLLIPRALTNRRTRKAATIGVTGYGVMAALSYLQNRTDPNYYNMDFSERAKVGFMLGSNEYFTSGARIGEKKPHFAAISPLSRELAAISAPITYALEHMEQALPEALRAEGSVPPRKEDFGFVAYNAYNSMNAILGISVNSLWGGVKALVPTEPGRIIFEIAGNHDSYFDRPIVPPGYENLPEEEQFDDYTSEMAKRVGPYIPGLNPFQLDYLLKTGEFEELVLIADTLIRKFIMDEDVVADSHYQELKDLLDHVEPNEMRTARRQFLSNFPKEMQDRIITIERQEPQTFPERIPIVSKTVDGFLRRKGGELHNRGIIAAEELTNMSAEQTREVARSIGQFWGETGTAYMQDQENGLLAYIENPFPRTGVDIVSPQEFIESERVLNIMFQTKLMEFKRDFPKAAQLQDKQTWLDWQNEVFSVGKQLDDRRSVAEINAALLRAVPLFDLVDNEEITIGDNVSTKNWRKYFEYRDEVEKEIIKNFGQKGLDEAEEILTASLTTWQKIRREDFDFIRPYWDVADWILDKAEEGGASNIREEYEFYQTLEGEAAVNYLNKQVIVKDDEGNEYRDSSVLSKIVNGSIPNARKDLLTGLLFYENGKWVHIKDLSDAEKSEQLSHGFVGPAGWTEPLLRDRKIKAAEMEKKIIFWGVRENVIGYDSKTGTYNSADNGLNSAWDSNRQTIHNQQRQVSEQLNIQR